MKKDGYSESTLETFGRRLRYLAKHADLGNPEGIKEFIARKGWSNGYKDKPTENIDITVRDVCQALPQDVLSNLNVAVCKQDPKTIHVVPKKFLGKDNWHKVNEAVKAMRGEWVSQGKHSYWWVTATQQAEV